MDRHTQACNYAHQLNCVFDLSGHCIPAVYVIGSVLAFKGSGLQAAVRCWLTDISEMRARGFRRLICAAGGSWHALAQAQMSDGWHLHVRPGSAQTDTGGCRMARVERIVDVRGVRSMASNNAFMRYGEGLLVGGIVGLVLGLLYAPKPGGQLRKELGETSDQYLHRANDRLNDVMGQVSTKVQPLMQRTGELKDKVSVQAGKLRNNLAEQAGTLKRKASVIRGRIGQSMQRAQEAG
jgi:gas vesicle protein